MLGNIALAIVIVIAYFWWAFIRLPQKNEQRRQDAISTLQIATEAWATPYGMDKTQTMESAQKTVRSDWGIAETATPPITTPTPTEFIPTATATEYEVPTPSSRLTIHPSATPINGYDPSYTEFLTDPLLARISYYWPPLCGTDKDPNCINGDHDLFRTADGSDWIAKVQDGWNILACPQEFPIGTKFLLFGEVWVCLDRGGAIAYNADFDYYWLDLLVPEMPNDLPWGVYASFQIVE